MKLLFIYGPPAVGKLTISRELEYASGYKIFHNHLTADLVKSVFEYGSKPYFDLIYKIRLDMFNSAAKEGISLITTFVYAPDDDGFIADIKQVIETHGGEMVFVQLDCDKEVLKQRVIAESRKEFQKIHTVEVLEKYFDKWELGRQVKYDNVLKIDTTHLAQEEVAQIIIKKVQF